ncbi:hypothetical protein GGS24DRAFT_49510 [Hypoxylon argillaceum]|nr:hypothetical protein GGS24DRAFT_49510 [Hypoxylon argillaceum]KAI1150956.1 hypothetical protein F4825DRAFT_424571 [Nemania diffusa]
MPPSSCAPMRSLLFLFLLAGELRCKRTPIWASTRSYLCTSMFPPCIVATAYGICGSLVMRTTWCKCVANPMSPAAAACAVLCTSGVLGGSTLAYGVPTADRLSG